ncbi:uncharacterized protein MYCFIDRAFT_213042 [Pseudocercospora fijiensis CIRAD86]|uniref:Uncharacterized protein n=1 Tax=Pseudocercospora fijiensis (strain CIRAD86) TaxID=383855 RepID=N1Q6D2_PSEFD|nr:uncharacterized protein MYCFIDRAFT_213042 [Pseudocercospora fijiensis CIRAD86]EME87854.1 hypothetical protein MYCFIDRAFT_213042 [Pseudocercospora fijiensis CIRAD86]
MESSAGRAFITTTISGGAMAGRRSFETAPSSAARLHKQRSNHGMRSTSHGQPFSLSSAPEAPPIRSSALVAAGFGDGAKARKGSIRNAVRKIFGRRSRDSISQVTDASSSSTQAPSTRHICHKSEPPVLPAQPELPELQLEDASARRVMSDPYAVQSHTRSTSLSRTASPYAVQFPNSVRLKPMDLGNPFMQVPKLRRRKTLPSMLIEKEEGAAAIAGSSHEAADEPSTSNNIEPEREAPMIPKRTPNSVKKSRRKSRSVDDLPSIIALQQQGTPRKRSEEIKYWRESFQPDVLRASGFIARPSSNRDNAQAPPSGTSRRSNREGSIQETGGEKTARSSGRGAYDASLALRDSTLKSSPPGQYGQPLSVYESEYRPSSGTEMSRDLEDRVAKLEAGLHTFQRSLQKLTADRNRRTIVMGSSVGTRRSSGDLRTPSLLADTLADALDQSFQYEYEYGHTLRPTTSPQPPPPIPPHVQGLEDPFIHETAPPPPSEPPTRPPRPPSPAQLTPEALAAVNAEARGSKDQTPQPCTFRSLYQMLADERSARRKLESQLQSLRRDISELHSQVHVSSNVQSTRSSYMLAGSSSRLQDLLRETGEASGPEESPRSLTLQRLSGASASQPVVSRFSGSESDNVQVEETDYEEYLTPKEERSKISLADKLERESGMF